MKQSLSGLHVVLLIMASCAGGSVFAQDAGALLGKTAERYARLDSYRVAGAVSVRTLTPVGEQAFDLTFLVARRPPGFLRAELRGGAIDVVVVANNEGTWVYNPPLNQFTYQRDGVPSDVVSITDDLLGEYRRLDQNVLRTRIVGPDTLGDAIVVEAHYGPGARGAGADSTTKRLWIERERGVVLRDETKAFRTDASFGQVITVAETTVFEQIEVGDPPSLDLFDFDPPTDAQRVDPAQLVQGSGVRRGQPAPPFRLAGLDGKVVQLSDLRGAIVLINLWATWCGPCRMEMPELERIHRAHGGDDLYVLGVNLGEPAAQVRDFVAAGGFTFPILLDERASLASQYGPSSLPTTFVVDREGRISSVLVGAHPEEAFLQAVRQAGF